MKKLQKLLKNKYAIYLLCLFTIIFVLNELYIYNMISLLVLKYILLSLNIAIILLIAIFRKRINNIYIIITFIIFVIYNTVNIFITIYPDNLIGNKISLILFILFGLSFYKANSIK